MSGQKQNSISQRALPTHTILKIKILAKFARFSTFKHIFSGSVSKRHKQITSGSRRNHALKKIPF